MLKLFLTGIWVAVVALGSVYASIELSKPVDPAEEEARKRAVRELVRGEMVTFPVINEGRVEGYFLTRTSYIVDKNILAEVTLPIPALLTDELYTALVGDRLIRVHENRTFDVAAFRTRIKNALNQRLGKDAVLDVIIEQVDFLSKDDIRNSQEKKQAKINTGTKIISEEIPPGYADKAESPSH